MEPPLCCWTMKSCHWLFWALQVSGLYLRYSRRWQNEGRDFNPNHSQGENIWYWRRQTKWKAYARDAQNATHHAGGAAKNILRQKQHTRNKKRQEKNPLYYTTWLRVCITTGKNMKGTIGGKKHDDKQFRPCVRFKGWAACHMAFWRRFVPAVWFQQICFVVQNNGGESQWLIL